MTKYACVHAPTGHLLAVVDRAETFWAKGWGVLGRRTLPAGSGLWLPGVASVHTLGVRFALDIVFLDGERKTLRAAQSVSPNRGLIRASGAAHTLELGAGTLAALGASVQNGDLWRLERVP